MTRTLTLTDAAAKAKLIGISIKRTPAGDIRVWDKVHGTKDSDYFTDNVQDAFNTALAIRRANPISYEQVPIIFGTFPKG